LSTHTNHTEQHEVYFCTITCYKWLSLFEEANAYPAIYRWFNHLKKDGCYVVGYVIMPNHLHVLLYPTRVEFSLNKLVGEGKRFIAYDIVNTLKKSGNELMLATLSEGVDTNEKLKGKKHQVFQLSFDARKCFHEKMVEQKLDYIHHNPVQGKWSLVDDFATYEHSSAGFYELGVMGKTEITHYKELGKEMASDGKIG
jgi:REP element-mobilizing transposase RayT